MKALDGVRWRELLEGGVRMAKSAISFDAVRRMGLELPGVEESTAYGMPALKMHGKLLVAVPANRSVEPNSLVVRMGSDERAELLAEAPEVYYLPEHYANYDGVLVRLSRVSPEVLRDLLGMAYKFVTRQAAPHSPAPQRRKPRPEK
jgi:hypothetical protein